MKRTSITVEAKRTMNLGDYESLTWHLGWQAELEDGDDSQDVYAQLTAEVEESLKALMMPAARDRVITAQKSWESMPGNVKQHVLAAASTNGTGGHK